MPSSALNQLMMMYERMKQLVEHDTLTDDVAAQYQHQLAGVVFDDGVAPAEQQFLKGLQNNISAMLAAAGHHSIFLTIINDNGSFSPFEINVANMIHLRETDLDLYNRLQDDAFIYQTQHLDGPAALALFQQAPWAAGS
ncbi:hypothetical protein LROSL1_1827 [Furfurilactobacillus rossiae]|uniref:hypothetical protein n=1 Tax=Furfurilactobacillus rossiae TaxID=231049 RepID=UPI0015BF3D9F|nr:hypothetical protein [Furfurilactobacillus rossiae]MCF6166420.1 hypothetical protein [Furfurilactobacillus rossiae]QLE64643.1 hypothetical protein LROSL1_1827 [Furfurilactobacillus rossiae]